MTHQSKTNNPAPQSSHGRSFLGFAAARPLIAARRGDNISWRQLLDTKPTFICSGWTAGRRRLGMRRCCSFSRRWPCRTAPGCRRFPSITATRTPVRGRGMPRRLPSRSRHPAPPLAGAQPAPGQPVCLRRPRRLRATPWPGEKWAQHQPQAPRAAVLAAAATAAQLQAAPLHGWRRGPGGSCCKMLLLPGRPGLPGRRHRHRPRRRRRQSPAHPFPQVRCLPTSAGARSSERTWSP